MSKANWVEHFSIIIPTYKKVLIIVLEKEHVHKGKDVINHIN